MTELQRRVSDEVVRSWQLERRVVGEAAAVRDASESGGGEKLPGFFTMLGAPEAGVGGEKPGTFFTSEAGEANVGEQDTGEAHVAGIVVGRTVRRGELRPASDTVPLPGPAAPVKAAQGNETATVSTNRGGRPTVLTPALREKLEMLLSVGMSRRQAAAYLGIDHTTIVKAAARDPELALDLRNAEERATVNPLLTIIGESHKNWRAAAWLLKYRSTWPVDRAPKTEEEKELEHQEQLREDARSAERSKLQMIAMREVVEAGATKVVRQQTTMSPGWKKRKR